MRIVLGACTCFLVLYVMFVQDGRLPDNTQFWAILASLLAIAILAVDGCSSAGPMAATLGSLIAPGAFEAFEEQVLSIQNLPWAAYNAIAPSLERVTSTVRGDAGTTETATTDLEDTVYLSSGKWVGGKQDQIDLQGADGKIDSKKFSAMKLEYKRIVILLCRMKTMAPDLHDTLVTAIGGCTAADEKQLAVELSEEQALELQFDLRNGIDPPQALLPVSVAPAHLPPTELSSKHSLPAPGLGQARGPGPPS